jgi:hypothetical protein
MADTLNQASKVKVTNYGTNLHHAIIKKEAAASILLICLPTIFKIILIPRKQQVNPE